jgi:hypothetical protein
MFEKKEGHRAYITRNSMEFYPSQRPNTISTTAWKNLY